FGIEDGSDIETLQQGTPGDIFGEILDRDARLGAADVGLSQYQFIEGDIARWRQLDLLNGFCHVSFSRTAGRKPLSRPPSRSRSEAPPSCSKRAAPRNRRNGEGPQTRELGFRGLVGVRRRDPEASSPSPPYPGGHPDAACRARRR